MTTPTTTAFKLRDEYAETFSGATINHPDHGTFDIGAALDDAAGDVLVVDLADHQLVDVLRGVPVLEEVAPPAGRAPDEHPYTGKTVDELRAIAAGRSVDLPNSARKGDIVAALLAADHDHADGDTPDAPTNED
jgi:hypothetical protein